jgi:uncharacterized RDD family membrane protein YckC/methionine-rich copper-binding protein CopC
MKKTNRTWLHSLMVAGSLLLAPAITAQETSETASTNSSAPEQTTLEAADAVSNTPAVAVTNTSASNEAEQNWVRPRQIVLMGQNAELKAGETAEEVVVIGGSAKIHGKVTKAAVVIGGTLEVDGEVGDAAVAVLGNIRINRGAVIHRDAVAVLGNLTIAQGAKVEHNAVSVAGKLDVADGATVYGEKVNVGIPVVFSRPEWLKDWVKYCVLEFRPLAPQVGWVWAIAGVFFFLYLFIAAVFPHPVQVCVEGLVRRPATTFLMGLLTKLFVPVVFLILAVTGIGLIVVPFLVAVLFLAAIIGKVAMLEWLGLQVGRHFGGGFQKPLVGFLIGTILITLLYMVPILGLLVYTIISVWGLGCAVTAAFGSIRREMPAKPLAPSFTPGAPAAAPVQTMNAQAFYSTAAPTTPATGVPEPGMPTGDAPQVSPQAQPARAAEPGTPPVLPLSLSFPRAGFWERMGAGFLDVVIVGFLTGIAHGPLGFLLGILTGPPVGLVIALAYFAGMWTWKGTTIGGIVLKLQVVRSDGGPLTFVVALVRGLAAALSVAVLFLGFLWIAWDKDKQGWHDKIAGTEVIRLPRSTPLVCV